MPCRQLRLFPHARPLLERLGRGFFDAVPRSPGVYIMRGEGGDILYIGQSGDLRARLFSYKNARPGSVPRKVIRLVHQVRAIEWQLCPTRFEALRLESYLLREHQPRFNSAHTWPAAWYYLGLREEDRGIDLRWTEHPSARRGERLFGAFRGRMLARYLMGVLARVMAVGWLRPAHVHQLPLLPSRRCSEWTLVAFSSPAERNGREALALLEGFLAGRSCDWLDWVEEGVLDEASGCHAVLRDLVLEDLETLRDFYERGPCRAAAQRRASGLSGTIWFPEETSPPTGRNPPGRAQHQGWLVPPESLRDE